MTHTGEASGTARDALGTARDASHGRGADTARYQSTMSQSVKEHRLSLSRRRLKKGAQLNAGFAGRGAVSTVIKRQDGSICQQQRILLMQTFKCHRSEDCGSPS